MEKVRCPACGFLNPDTLKQCVSCGAVLPTVTWAGRWLRRVTAVLKPPPAAQVGSAVVPLADPPTRFTAGIDTVYEVEEVLGRGGYCTVYRVRRVADGYPMAIKLCRLWEIASASRTDVETRFWLEYALGQNGSNYLIATHQKGRYSGNPFFVMDYADGGSLAARIGSDWPDHRLKAVAVDMLRGLAQLHQAGVIHRDLKPSNVVFVQNCPKLIDFGISGRLTVRLTKPDEALGTDVYMAPELFRRTHKEYQSKLPTIDVYSFGVLLFELLSGGLYPHGEPPDTANRNAYHLQVADYCRRVQAEDWQYLTQLRARGALTDFWADLIIDCLRANPAQRIQDVETLLSRLGEVEPLLFCVRCGCEQLTRRVARCVNCSYDLIGPRVGLLVINGPDASLFYDLSQVVGKKGLVTIGRYPDFELTENDVELRDEQEEQPYISRYHATIERSRQTGEWFVRDGQWRETDADDYAWLPSSNGVFVNAARAYVDGLPIFPGDILTFGDVKLRVELRA